VELTQYAILMTFHAFVLRPSSFVLRPSSFVGSVVYNSSMGILLPTALALLALAIPIIIFYMLRLRRQELGVSSSLLWRRALLDRTANAPWQRLRRNLLLLLQLLLLLLLVLSLARPFLYADTVAIGNMVVILDGSASMQAADEGGRSRFERARQEAASLIDAMQGDQRMSLVWAGPTSSVAASSSNNKAALHDALKALSASNGKADMTSALTLAAASARQLGEATLVLISDGAFPADRALPQVPGKATYVNVGVSSQNVGITSLSLRESQGGPQLFAALYNSGTEPATTILTIKVDGNLRDSLKVEIPAGGEQSATLQDLPLDTRLVEAQLSREDRGSDYLAADNAAWALRASRPASNVLLVTEGNGFLEKSLNLMPNVRLFKATPATYAPSDGFGLTVLDGYIPAQLPAGNLLVFAPPDSPTIPVSGTLAYPQVGQVAVNDPLMRFVDLSQTHLASAQRIFTPTWARVLASTAGGDPLIIAGETDGRRVAAVAFDLHKSDLPLQIAFPILVANLVEWLQPRTSVEAPPQLGAGDAITIRPLPETDEIRVTPPNQEGRHTSLQPSSQVSFARTEALGVYTVQQMSKGRALGDAEQFAVNLFSRDESNIAPRADVGFTGSQPTPDASAAKRPLEIWPWVLLASLLLLTVEWWYYNRPRGLRFPRLKAPRRGKAT